MTGLLVGLPLFGWSHYRAPTLLILIGQALAYLLLDSVLRRIVSPRERLVFAVLYWLNPWRLFHSGFLWGANYLLIFGGFHLWTAYGLWRSRRFWLTFLHVLILGIAIQVNISALALAVLTGVLWWRRYIRIHAGGALAAMLVTALTLFPWLLAVIEDPSRLPQGEGFLGHGFVVVYPVVQGIVQWLRFPAIALSRAMVCLDFSDVGGAAHDQLAPFASAMRGLLSAPTLVISAWATWRLWRRRRGWSKPLAGDAPGREWLEGLIRWSFVTAVVAFGLSPISIKSWHVLPFFHVAVLPMVLAYGSLLQGSRSAAWGKAVLAHGTLLVVIGLALALGSPPYRCGPPRCEGKSFRMPELRSDHRMFDDLGIRAACPLEVNKPGAWWPDMPENEKPAPAGDQALFEKVPITSVAPRS
jgi:hypothetical protein